jgi:hypothetical protein
MVIGKRSIAGPATRLAAAAVVTPAGTAGAATGASGVAATGWRTGNDEPRLGSAGRGAELTGSGRDGTTPDEHAPNSAAIAATPQARMSSP